MGAADPRGRVCWAPLGDTGAPAPVGDPSAAVQTAGLLVASPERRGGVTSHSVMTNVRVCPGLQCLTFSSYAGFSVPLLPSALHTSFSFLSD